MKVAIKGTAYDLVAPISADMIDLLVLKKATGLGIDELQEAGAALSEATERDGILATLGNEQHLLTFLATLWLSRRKTGESVSWEDGCRFALDDLEFIPDPDEVVDDEPDADPSP